MDWVRIFTDISQQLHLHLPRKYLSTHHYDLSSVLDLEDAKENKTF